MTRKFNRKNKTLLHYDFTKGYSDKHFVNVLGTDGCITSDGDGLTVNSMVYKSTHPQGEMGWLDNFKWNGYYHTPIECSRSRETIFEAKIANKQFFGNKDRPFPVSFGNRVRDMFADPRLCHGQFSIVDPKSSVWSGFLLTDHVLYGVYGRLPDGSLCKYHDKYASECEPCKGSDVKYGCDNFWQDCRYLDFKQNANESVFKQFQEYVPWCAFARFNNVDVANWQVFSEWRRRHAINCDAYSRQDFVAWKSHHDWDEYCCFGNWDGWYRQYLDWSRCSSDDSKPGSCRVGECSSRLLGGGASGDKCSTCYHHYESGKNCYGDESGKATEQFPYEWNAGRNCCCAASAVFVDLIPLQTRGACDPLCDWVKVAVGVDRRYKTLNYYVDNQLVHQVVGVGRRSPDQYRVRENGGYAGPVDIYKVLVSFGTGSLLDAQLPDNYSRYRVKDDYISTTGLVPLMNASNYFQTSFNRIGELQFVNLRESFAARGDGSNNAEDKLFLQGDIFKIEYIDVFTKPATRGYRSQRSLCPETGCCGVNANDGYYGLGAYYGAECPRPSDCLSDDCSSEDEYCNGRCSPDPRDYRIEFDAAPRPSLVNTGPQVQYSNASGSGSACGTTARLVRTDKNRRYWEKNCGNDEFGTDPYTN